jgi:hypothetical protein
MSIKCVKLSGKEGVNHSLAVRLQWAGVLAETIAEGRKAAEFKVLLQFFPYLCGG